MKPVTPELLALFRSRQFLMADLITIGLIDGSFLRYTTADHHISHSGLTFRCDGPLINLPRGRWTLGMEVDSLTLEVMPGDGQPLILGQHTFPSAVRLGLLDGASFTRERVYLSSWTEPAVGSLILFSGFIGEISGGGTQLEIQVNSYTDKLNVQWPRNLWQPTCLHTVYDTGCGLNRAAFLVHQVNLEGGYKTLILINDAHAAGYFDNGTATFTSGPNLGVTRSIKKWNGSSIVFLSPLPFAAETGDTVDLLPGCERTRARCENPFNNLARFRGFPYIPEAETAI